jgi:hypothetical protein
MATTLSHEAAFTTGTDQPLAKLLFDQPGASIILRSQDSCHLRVPKSYIVNSSPILGDIIRKALDSSGHATSLPVVQLPESGSVIHSLLTFIFPVTPLLPSTPQELMELLFVAQKYQMGTTLTHIRGSISQQNLLLPSGLEQALHIYALAQNYGLRPEALRMARAIFLKQSMTIEDFSNKPDIMPCTSLYELLKYHKEVRTILASDLEEFTVSARGMITDLRCTKLSFSQTPSWLDRYIESIGNSPNLFDYAEFNIALGRHIKDNANEPFCMCASIPGQTISNFWDAMAPVVNDSFVKVSCG